MPARQDPMTETVYIFHPATDPNRLYSELNTPGNEYSLEFATWIREWDRGRRERTQFDLRNWDITQRKGLYGAQLINFLGEFTGRGAMIRDDILKLCTKLEIWKNETGEHYPDLRDPVGLEDVLSLDRLVLIGHFTTIHLRFLRLFYEANPASTADAPQVRRLIRNTETPRGPEELEFFHWNTLNMFNVGRFRNSPTPRRAVEHLLKFGFLDYYAVPRQQAGLSNKGRPVTGAVITPAGRKFYELFLDSFSERAKREREIDEGGLMMEKLRREMPNPLTTPIPPAIRAHIQAREESAESASPAYADDEDLFATLNKTIIHTDPSGVVIGASGPKMQMIMDLLADGVVMGRKDAEELLED